MSGSSSADIPLESYIKDLERDLKNRQLFCLPHGGKQICAGLFSEVGVRRSLLISLVTSVNIKAIALFLLKLENTHQW
ncbi:MAG: hypothetical protein V7K40_12325 [Nostoc sp.]|uniref:hypothetical protein n=1 Tax=Nostoc sp. TaxID=1180 RepID=UPI002FF60283